MEPDVVIARNQLDVGLEPPEVHRCAMGPQEPQFIMKSVNTVEQWAVGQNGREVGRIVSAGLVAPSGPAGDWNGGLVQFTSLVQSLAQKGHRNL